MSLLANWYFTACLNMRPKDASDLMAIYDAFEDPKPTPRLARAAISELQRCDVWAKVYALPKLVRLARADRTGQLRELVDGFIRDTINACDDDDQGVLLTLWAVRAENQGIDAIISCIERAADRLGGSSRQADETVPYLSLPGLIAETLLLSFLAGWVENVGVAPVLLQRIKDNMCPALQAFISKAMNGSLGRLAALQAATISPALESEGAAGDLAFKLVGLPESAGLMEPDIADMCAWLELGRAGNPVGQAAAACLEFENPAQFHKLRETSSFSHEVAEQVIRRLGALDSDAKWIEQINWETALIFCCGLAVPVALVELAASRWSSGPLSARLRRERGEFVEMNDAVKMWRLAVASVLGVRLAGILDSKSAARARLLIIAAHAEAVYATKEHNKWLQCAGQPDSRKPEPPSLPAPITSMVLFARLAVRDWVMNNSTLGPQEWLNAAKSATWMLPVLVRWIEGILMGPPDDVSVRRWQAALPTVLHASAEMKRTDGWEPKVRLAGVLLGKLCCNVPVPAVSLPRWWEEITSMGTLTKSNLLWTLPRRIIGSPLSCGRDWLEFNWMIEDRSVPPAVRLSAAVERFLSNEDTETDSLRNDWGQDLAGELARVFVSEELDRWLRHRLLDVVTHPRAGLAGKLATQLIVQLGQPADVSRLVSKLLAEIRPPVPDLEWKLSLVAEGLAARSIGERQSQVSRTRTEIPRTVLRAYAEADYWLIQSATILAFCPLGTASIRQRFSEIRRRQAGLHRPAMLQSEAVEASYQGRTVLALRNEGRAVDPWMMQQIIEDPAQGLFTILYSRYWLQDTCGNKQNPAVIVGTMMMNGSVPVVDAHTGAWLGSQVLDRASRIADGLGGIVLPEIDRKHRTIKRMPAEASFYPASGRRHPNGCAEFKVEADVLNPTIRAHWQIWDADESRHFDPAFTHESWKNLIVMPEGRGWKPARRHIHDLIAETGGSGIPFSIGLTWVTAEADPDRKTWLFSAGPGSLFELGPELFSPNAATILRERIDREKGDITGLGVHVTAMMESGAGRLVLHASSEDINDRNLKWRGLLRAGDVVSAAWSDTDHSYIVRTGMPSPFPEVLVARWDGDIPNQRKALQVTALVTRWEDDDRRQKQVWLALADAVRLQPENSDYMKLRSHILGLGKGELVTLTRAFGKAGSQGNVLAVMQGNLVVHVASESLSLLPDDGNPLIPPGTQRPAVISNVWQAPSDVRLEISPQDLAQLGDGEHVGIVLETPNRRAVHGVCQVLFAKENKSLIIPASLLSDTAPRLGSKVHVTFSSGNWVVNVDDIVVYAEALYRARRVNYPPANARFVGYYIEQGQRFQAWIEPPNKSELLVCTDSTGRRPRIFENWSREGNLRLAMPPLTWKSALNVSRSSIKDFDHYRMDVNMEIKQAYGNEDETESALLAGWCPGLARVNLYEITGVELHAFLCVDNLFYVRRVFNGSRCDELDDEEEPEISTRPDREAELAKLEAEGQPVSVSVIVPSDDSSRTWSVLVKSLLKQRFSNSQSRLNVPIEELPHFHQAREIRYDAQKARVMLIRESGHWQASFRRVPLASLESFHAETGALIGAVFQPPSLIFIGRGDDQPLGSCRFEFGFGWVMEAPEDRVMIDSYTLSSLRTVLYHGDRIKALRFTLQTDGKLCIQILGVDIAYGDAHRVFLQASDHQFVHTLVLESEGDGKPRVIAVKGFSDGSERAQQEFSIPHATLEGSGADAWQHRFQNAKQPQITVYARLNVERFVETAGRVCEFHPVSFSFGTENGMRKGDRLLVEAGTMERTASLNDIRLALKPLAGAEPANDRDKPSSLIVLRRDFSVIESLLGRFLSPTENRPNALQGSVFAVYVQDFYNDGAGQASLLQMPARRWKSLVGSLRSSSGPTFAAIANAPSQKTNTVARIEVRPGVFFDFEKGQLDNDSPASLASGTLVRVELVAFSGAPDKVRLVPCQFSPWRYLSQTRARPGTALPIDALLKDGASTHAWNWSGTELFTASDFSSVKFSADRTECWGENLPIRQIMPEFMSLPHPKFAWLRRRKGKDRRDHAILFPADAYIDAGWLHWDKEGAVWMAQQVEENIRVRWHLLSYADTSIAGIKERCARRGWFVHDKQTGHWTDRGIERPAIGRLSVSTGPLFFDNHLNEYRLRYKSSDLTIFGVPLGNIADTFGLDGLNARGTHVEATVAAIHECEGRCDGIWIEWVPGRVIELPVEMLTWRSGPELLPLGSFDWSHLACGDELELRLVAGEALAPDRIELVAWLRGPRGACVPPNDSAALMPRGEAVKGEGLRLGAGAFQLTLPIARQDSLAESYWLHENNLVEPFANQQLHSGDIVLIEANTATHVPRLMVAGISGVEARPDEHDHSQITWDKHPLGESLIRRGPHQKRCFHLPAFFDLIHAAGGALPVTVEAIDKKNRIVWFSFRRQHVSIRPDGITHALVLGATADLSRVALWLGKGVCFLGLQETIHGLPAKLWPVMVREMPALRIPVWVTGHDKGDTPLRVGIRNDPSSDLWVVPVAAIDDGQDSAGLLVRSCKSQRLYWIPQECLAWTDLTLEEIRELFGKARIRDQALRARLRFGNDGFAKLSLLDTAEARRELNDLYPGHELRVVVVATTSGPEQTGFGCWLVRSLDTGLLLRCDGVPHELRWSVGDTRLVEVSSRRFRQTHQVTCEPQGHRTIPITLPHSAIRQISAMTAEPRPSPWREEARRCSQMSTEELLVGPAKDAPIDISLVWAWELCIKRSTFAAYASEAALTWIKKNGNSSSSFLSEALMAASILCTLVAAGPTWVLAPPLRKDEAVECLRHWWRRAFTLLGQLHGRILRSLHLAILMSRLTRAELESDKRFAALYQRLLGLLSASLPQRERAEVLRLADQLLMDMGENRHEFAGALMSCLGITPPAQAMPKSNNLADPVRHLEQLAHVCAPFASAMRDKNNIHEPEALLAANLAICLNGALSVCNNQPWDMVLLGELAPLFVTR